MKLDVIDETSAPHSHLKARAAGLVKLLVSRILDD